MLKKSPWQNRHQCSAGTLQRYAACQLVILASRLHGCTSEAFPPRLNFGFASLFASITQADALPLRIPGAGGTPRLPPPCEAPCDAASPEAAHRSRVRCGRTLLSYRYLGRRMNVDLRPLLPANRGSPRVRWVGERSRRSAARRHDPEHRDEAEFPTWMDRSNHPVAEPVRESADEESTARGSVREASTVESVGLRL